MANTPNPSAGSATAPSDSKQFGRVIKLVMSNAGGAGLDLSQLRIKFSVKKSSVMTPNVANIRVYNLDPDIATFIKKEFTDVLLQAGYNGNFGVIFQGNIKWSATGRESATDTFLDVIAGDGDKAYNFAVVNTTIGSALSGGSSPTVQLGAAISSMGTKGVSPGYVAPLPAIILPRGKVMYGNARDYIKNLADTAKFAWSMQDEKIVFIPQGQYLPGDAVVLTSKTGLIGTPQQTVVGVNCKCLLNPKLKVHGRIWVNNASVAAFQIDPFAPGSPANTPPAVSADGFYYISLYEHTGDTREIEWYSNIVSLSVDVTSPLNDSVQAGFGS